MPLLLLRHGRPPVAQRHIATLRSDPRLELLEPELWTPDAVALATRVAATLVVAAADPMRALAYAVTAGITGNIVMVVPERHRGDRALLLEAGAMAFYTFPMNAAEINALLALLDPRPRLTHTDTTLRLTLDPISRVARYRDRAVRLSQREFAVLHCLSTHSGKPVDADELLRVVWGTLSQSDRPRQIVDVYVHQLRKKLGALGIVNGISTIRRFGYALGAGATR